MFDACATVATIFRWARFVEQSWRHEWEKYETDNGKAGHRCKGVPPLSEHVWSPLKQQNEHAHGDKEVSRAVIGVHQLDKPHMRQEKILN